MFLEFYRSVVKKSYLQYIADEIFKTCSDNNIRVNPVRKPRAENKKADTLSRLTDMIN